MNKYETGMEMQKNRRKSERGSDSLSMGQEYEIGQVPYPSDEPAEHILLILIPQ